MGVNSPIYSGGGLDCLLSIDKPKVNQHCRRTEIFVCLPRGGYELIVGGTLLGGPVPLTGKIGCWGLGAAGVVVDAVDPERE